MDTPSYQAPPIDPLALSAEQSAEADQIRGLQTRTTGDSASLMAQYGILAMATGTGGGPAAGPVPFGGAPTGTLFAPYGTR